MDRSRPFGIHLLFAVVLSIGAIGPTQTSSASPFIDRSFGAFRLGAPLATVKGPTAIERPDAFFGQQAEEVRLEVVPPGRPEEIETMNLDFFDGILYRIEAIYPSAYAKKVGWAAFTREARRRYGQPRQVEMEGSEILFWDDGITRLLISHDRDEGGYTLRLIDDAILHQVSRARPISDSAATLRSPFPRLDW